MTARPGKKPKVSRLLKALLAVVSLLGVSIALMTGEKTRRASQSEAHLPMAQNHPTSTSPFVSPNQPSDPQKSENGDVRGRDNDNDGRPETTYVEGFTRKDGVKVKGHYRAKK